jgi:hypothetical protein
MKYTRTVLVEKDLPSHKKDIISFDNMSFFKEASHRKLCGFGYNVRRFKIVWENKEVSWNWIAVEWGIRNSELLQIFPIWNVSHNGQRALMFGFWKLYFSILYNRKQSFNQNRKLLFRKKLWNFYQLLS